ncbi:hypothetical protein LMG31506_06078 [Cupriavidus yeoncheonensis]|uniref:Uncharacterized protein n=1 Tax=Cupriavidus yeoncheonensis TaxID=1462994 RepID=A0A916NG57_9BURK|nr:hypothetical protein LMG31506_06078 [Cupriavidus yeoncheonensis]
MRHSHALSRRHRARIFERCRPACARLADAGAAVMPSRPGNAHKSLCHADVNGAPTLALGLPDCKAVSRQTESNAPGLAHHRHSTLLFTALLACRRRAITSWPHAIRCDRRAARRKPDTICPSIGVASRPVGRQPGSGRYCIYQAWLLPFGGNHCLPQEPGAGPHARLRPSDRNLRTGSRLCLVRCGPPANPDCGPDSRLFAGSIGTARHWPLETSLQARYVFKGDPVLSDNKGDTRRITVRSNVPRPVLSMARALQSG